MNMKHTNVAYTLRGDNLAMLQYNELLVDKTTMDKLFTLRCNMCTYTQQDTDCM